VSASISDEELYVTYTNSSVIFFNKKIILIRPKMWLANGPRFYHTLSTTY
jgi:predicted amidohydrolase